MGLQLYQEESVDKLSKRRVPSVGSIVDLSVQYASHVWVDKVKLENLTVVTNFTQNASIDGKRHAEPQTQHVPCVVFLLMYQHTGADSL